MTLWRWVQKGILPAPRKINKRNYWPESAIAAVANEPLAMAAPTSDGW